MSREHSSDSPDYQPIAAAFDLVAASYDQMYAASVNVVMGWMRAESIATLEATFPAGSRLLELGCGTGEEAIALARAGRKILATDISSAMVERVREKSAAAGLEHAITTKVMASAHVLDLADDGDGPFDGAYASFGVLNAEPDVAALADGLAHLLPGGAAFVTSVMARVCLWEMGWYMLHLKPGPAMRRLRKVVQAPLGAGQSVATRFYTPRKIISQFQPAFRVERIFALPLLLPPPYLDAFFRRHARLFEQLESVERRVRHLPPFNALGDHFVLVLRRV